MGGVAQAAVVIVGGLVGLAALAALLWRVGGGFPRKPRTPEEERARAEAWRARLLAPEWAAVERAHGRPAPPVLRELYADAQLVTAGDFTVRDPRSAGTGDASGREWDVSGFDPADPDALMPEWHEAPKGAFVFAHDDMGGTYFVTLGRLPDGDGPVYRVWEGGHVEPVAPSLRQFLEWPRAAWDAPGDGS